MCHSKQLVIVGSRRRCLTLLETLVALALLAGIAALVAPALISRFDERAFEAAADGASEQLMMARAHAQATGEAVEVTYSPSTGQVHARYYAPWSAAGDGDVMPGTSPYAQVDPSVSAAQQPDDWSHLPGLATPSPQIQARAIREAWASRPLGQGIRLVTGRGGVVLSGPGEDQAPEVADESHADELDALQAMADGQEVRLAVFMPDGSALVGEDLWINDVGGRRGLITINPWSGLPLFQRLGDLTDAQRSDDDSAEGIAEHQSTETAADIEPFLSPADVFDASTARSPQSRDP